MSRPQPENYGTAWGYFWAHRRWKQAHGGSLIVNVAVAVFAGAITGSVWGVVLFVGLAVAVTLARRRGDPGEAEHAADATGPAEPR